MNNIGIPQKVQNDDPIEFLELGKIVTAFLDLGLEKEKGGVGKQFLCGHLFGYIQEKGMEAIKKLPRFKSWYLEEIISKYNNKGIMLPDKSDDISTLIIENIKLNKKNLKPKLKTKKEAMEMTETTGLSARRRRFAENLIVEIQTEFNEGGYQINLLTRKFTHSSDDFQFEAPRIINQKIQKFLGSKNLIYYYSDGKFQIDFPEKYSDPKSEEKTKIKFCEKERRNLLHILSLKKYFPKKGGRGKKNPGIFSVNRSATMATSNLLKISIINKNIDTLNQILSVIRDHYSNHNKVSLVSVKQNMEDHSIDINYDPSFFEISKARTDLLIPKLEESITPKEIKPGKELLVDELKVLVITASEYETSLRKQIEDAEKLIEMNQFEFLRSVSSVFVSSFFEIFKKEGFIFFKVTIDNEGRQTFSEVKIEEIKGPISELVLEKLKLS
jgi:hypothetical protein